LGAVDLIGGLAFVSDRLYGVEGGNRTGYITHRAQCEMKSYKGFEDGNGRALSQALSSSPCVSWAAVRVAHYEISPGGQAGVYFNERPVLGGEPTT
jgi:hypothetical protein